MNRDDLILLVSNKLKLIRTEKDYTQDKMAEMLGLSKKTLVQIEKGRILAGWTTTIAVCTLFRRSDILLHELGDDPLVIIETLIYESHNRPRLKTMGGVIWWKEIKSNSDYILQQNLISQHFRILDKEKYNIYSSFDEVESLQRFDELSLS
ncbi:helix-turn-helix transcriptional regulator [Planococcus halotolerans]|uniref:Transcriptional regulator n=1 Tax=Planococcus halotolerans TaxID=2233542 RepID=A0A365KR16_9BACL|nr:helix-turn-helix domain-containing protein [Planococcus halotolerans]QHJ69596.1 helix-turn-helix domain-containing protein [Planococcus halotolerans]RAZ75545.1 transcriptional regulator [Planococcus halotolerans]